MQRKVGVCKRISGDPCGLPGFHGCIQYISSNAGNTIIWGLLSTAKPCIIATILVNRRQQVCEKHRSDICQLAEVVDYLRVDVFCHLVKRERGRNRCCKIEYAPPTLRSSKSRRFFVYIVGKEEHSCQQKRSKRKLKS